MQVIEARREGGPNGHVFVCRCTGDFGIPNLHRFGWCHRPLALDRISSHWLVRLIRDWTFKEF